MERNSRHVPQFPDAVTSSVWRVPINSLAASSSWSMISRAIRPRPRAAEQLTDLIGMLHEFAAGQSNLADQFLRGGEKRLNEDVDHCRIAPLRQGRESGARHCRRGEVAAGLD